MTSVDEGRINELIAAVEDAYAKGEDTTRLVEKYSLTERGRAMVELFNREEYEYVPSFLAHDHVHDMRHVHVPGMGVYRGREEYAKFVSDWTEAFPGAKLELELEIELTEPVQAIFAITKQEMRGGVSDVPIAFRYAMFAEYSDERHESTFGTDVDEMRNIFHARYGHDPGPFELEPLIPGTRQEA